jgi:hypothetical protein
MSKKPYIWEGKPVSRSTYYRMKGRGKRQAVILADRSLEGTKARLQREVHARRPGPSAVDLDRIESFIGMTEQHANGDPNEAVQMIVPRKWLQSVRKVLPKVA